VNSAYTRKNTHHNLQNHIN